MLVLHVLGSGSGLPTARRDTTSLLIGGPVGHSLVDCPGGIVYKLARLGLSPTDLRQLILTHNHVDHIYGLPHLVHALAIARSFDPLRILAPLQTLDTVRGMVQLHDLDTSRYPTLDLVEIPLKDAVVVDDGERYRVVATPTRHSRDTVALRFETDDAAVGISSDTAPSRAVAELCAEVDLLLHDCGGLDSRRQDYGDSHSSALEAGRVAAKAGVGALRLIHLSREAEAQAEALIREAGSAFEGPVGLAADGDVYRLGSASQLSNAPETCRGSGDDSQPSADEKQ